MADLRCRFARSISSATRILRGIAKARGIRPKLPNDARRGVYFGEKIPPAPKDRATLQVRPFSASAESHGAPRKLRPSPKGVPRRALRRASWDLLYTYPLGILNMLYRARLYFVGRSMPICIDLSLAGRCAFLKNMELKYNIGANSRILRNYRRRRAR